MPGILFACLVCLFFMCVYGSASVAMYRVRCEVPPPRQLHAYLSHVSLKHGSHPTYEGSGSFLVVLDSDSVDTIMSMEGVFDVSKTGYSGPKRVRRRRDHREGPDPDGPTEGGVRKKRGVVLVTLSSVNQSKAEEIAMQWHGTLSSSKNHLAGGVHMMSVRCNGAPPTDCDVDEVMSALGGEVYVIHAEEKPKYTTRNDWAAKIVQSSMAFGPVSGTLPVVWAAGMRGEGQVVGVADTGLDLLSCFFIDPQSEVPFCPSEARCRHVCVCMFLFFWQLFFALSVFGMLVLRLTLSSVR